MSHAAVLEFLRKRFEGWANPDELQLIIDVLDRLDGVDVGALREELRGWESWVWRGLVPLATQAGLDELREFFYEDGGEQEEWEVAWWERWSTLCGIFERWEDAGSLMVGLDYAEQHMSRWPASARTFNIYLGAEGWRETLPQSWPLVRELELSVMDEAFAQLRPTLSGLELSRITSLRIGWGEVTSRTLELVFERLPALTSLDLSHGQVQPDVAAHLVAVERPAGLKALTLSHKGLRSADVAALGAAGWFSGLASLNLSGNPIGSKGVTTLLGVLEGEALERLSLEYCNVGVMGVKALARAPGLRELTHLGLNGNKTDEASLLAIAAPTTTLKRLKSLQMSLLGVSGAGMGAGDRGAEALAASPIVGLEALDLGAHQIGDAGLAALAGSPGMARLKSLDLSCNRVGSAGLEALAGSAHITGLKALLLRENPMGGQGFKALVGSPNLGHVKRLDLFSSALQEQDVEALMSSPILHQIPYLFELGELPGGWRALLTSPHLSRSTRLEALEQRSVPELRRIGRQLGLARTSKLKRAELMPLLQDLI